MNLYLIRHGEIVKQYIHRYVGSTDVGLSHRGKQQAKKIAVFFKDIPIDGIYVSHRKRAIQTAKPLGDIKMVVVQQNVRLAEIDLGTWEGKTKRQVKKMIPKDIPCEEVTSGGERYTDFQKRVRVFVTELIKIPEETIVIVTHKGVIREMYKMLLNDENLIVDQEYGAINHFVIKGKTIEEKMRNKVA
jgi:broad specificity phosphatase PhoE